MTRILVTGAAGYIGSHTCVALLNAGYDVVGVDNFINSSSSVYKSIESITGKRMRIFDIDCRTDFDVPEKVDAIIHFAALKSVGDSVAFPVKYYDNNVLSTVKVMDVANRHRAPVVFSSSACVYGDKTLRPVTESNNLCPINPYGETKMIGEQIIRNISNRLGLNYANLRYFNPIGSHASGLLGDISTTNLMPHIIKGATGGCLQVFGDDYQTSDGYCVRDYVHVEDIADAHVKTVEYVLSNGSIDAMNLGTGYGTSVVELINLFEQANLKKVNYEVVGRRDGDAPVLVADVKLMKETLGFSCDRTLLNACESSYKFYGANQCK